MKRHLTMAALTAALTITACGSDSTSDTPAGPATPEPLDIEIVEEGQHGFA